ncbi:hypothetical protein [Faecalibaculum rodentium]|uniref:hypothetical protein n=1 Tax=Faecalibaculum rodentium TaxID=1702221 RepID=UPI0025B75BD9|nr:hypothetical protein [Faecalibaculum rodentium]
MNCFFITPIGEEGSKTREAADDVFHGLVKPVCEKIGYNPIRADQLTSTAFIAQEIFEHLNNDEMVIADVTDHNPNVYLELGYRMRTYKPFVIIRNAETSNNRPFDIAGIRSFDYRLRVSSLEEFQRKLETFIQSNAANSENIRLGLDDVFSVRREPNGSISVNPRKL